MLWSYNKIRGINNIYLNYKKYKIIITEFDDVISFINKYKSNLLIKDKQYFILKLKSNDFEEKFNWILES
ncbi:hypothetical protein O7983_000039 [Mycoplasmopsis felis]|uniref:hypothetical protein n=1 Tax=Mycoplasmopsis felis TaxID=33923 RepID=UPI003A4D75BA